MALVSGVKTTAEEILKRLRQLKPSLPIMFASLLTFDKARLVTNDVMSAAGVSGEVFGPQTG